jgi:hypothetical protein
VIRQSLAESVALAIGGTLIGAVLALIGVRRGGVETRKRAQDAAA